MGGEMLQRLPKSHGSCVSSGFSFCIFVLKLQFCVYLCILFWYLICGNSLFLKHTVQLHNLLYLPAGETSIAFVLFWGPDWPLDCFPEMEDPKLKAADFYFFSLPLKAGLQDNFSDAKSFQVIVVLSSFINAKTFMKKESLDEGDICLGNKGHWFLGSVLWLSSCLLFLRE